MNEFLERVRDFAATAHGHQMRKFSPEPYIEHPIRVMKTCMDYGCNAPTLAAALLHDVLEDTEVTRDELHQFLLSQTDNKTADEVTNLVVELTDVYVKKDYPKLNRRVRKDKEANRLGKTSREAQTIKYADIIDNSLTIVDSDTDFAKKYLLECRSLLKEMKNGNGDLLRKATEIVASCLERV